ncbi:MAG: ice-binding family protein, partial [Burkholderiales bacterium]
MNKYPSRSKLMLWSMALVLAGVTVGCGGGSSGSAGGAAGVPFATTNNSTSPGAVDLGTAASFVILAKSAVSTTGTTSIVGHVGVSPAAESFLTGFSQTRDASNTFSTSSLVTGNLYAADMAPPTP